MSEHLNKDEFEERLRRQVENYELKPPAEAWDNIYSQLPKKRRYKEMLLLAALLLILLGAGAYYFFVNHSSTTVHKMASSSITHQQKEGKQAERNSKVINKQSNINKGERANNNSNKRISADNITDNIKGKPDNGKPSINQNNQFPVVNASRNPIDNYYAFLHPLAILKPGINNKQEALAGQLNRKLQQNALNPVKLYSKIHLKENKQPLADSTAKQTGKRFGRHLRWNISVTPSLNYRSLKYARESTLASTPAPASYINTITSASVASMDIRHSPAAGFSATATAEIPLSKHFSLQAGLSLKKEAYHISAQKAAPTFITAGLKDLNGQSIADMSMTLTAMRIDTFTKKNSFYTAANARDFDPQQAVKINNEYYSAGVPIYASYQFGQLNHKHIRLSTGLDIDYLFYKKVNILAPGYKRYFKNSALIRRWNADYVVSAELVFPLQKYLLDIGPEFQYQLLSTYKNYTVKEHLYSTGIKIGLTFPE